MIRLERHIEILLLSNDCVIVPDLGGFMAHEVSARFDEEELLFLPPLRTLGFNPQLKLNDSLLAQSYVDAYDISYPEALNVITDEVRELNQHLSNEGSYELNNIGKLYVNKEGNLTFEPCEAGILTPELYGLSSFEICPLSVLEPVLQPKSKAKIGDDTINKALKNIVVDDKSIFAVDDEDDERTIQIKVSWLRNAVITAAAVVLLFLIVAPLSESTGFTMSNLSSEFFTSMIPKDTSIGDLNVNNISKGSSSKRIEKPVMVKDSNIVDNKMLEAHQPSRDKDSSRYCIILASRITLLNAERFVGELRNSGIKDAYTYVHNDIVRVAYGHFARENDAQDSLRQLKDNRYFEQAWVYELRVKN